MNPRLNQTVASETVESIRFRWLLMSIDRQLSGACATCSPAESHRRRRIMECSSSTLNSTRGAPARETSPASWDEQSPDSLHLACSLGSGVFFSAEISGDHRYFLIPNETFRYSKIVSKILRIFINFGPI
jgi:hypothetical protein